MDFTHFGHGAKKRPDHLKVKDHLAGAVAPFNWSQIKEDVIGNVTGLFGLADQDQNGSSTCTVQTLRYGFKYAFGLDISVEDIYAHVVLPGGGAYLTAPLDYARNTGVARQAQYPDPDPQSEQAMTRIIQIKVGDRVRTFELKYTLYSDVSNIDSAAWAATQHTYIHLGVDGSWTHGWNNPVDPVWQGVDDWQHALFVCKEGIVLRRGVPAIKARSSWCRSGIFCHYLNKDFFKGVFEIIGVDLKEISMGEFVQTSDTEFGLEYKTDFVTTVVRFTSNADAVEKLKNVTGALKPDGTVAFSKARRINL